MRNIEILAPAGSLEGLKAAIHASCDAIYIGGDKFGARAYANNLSREDMFYAIDYAHVHGKQIYLTVNTLFKEQELVEELYDYIKPYYEQGIDAVIVQDFGAMHFIHNNFKGLDIHASTQMSLTMGQSGDILKDYGVTRLVNARELSLGEMKEFRKNTTLEIESFVHGALCYCYSGQCLMSSMFGGRSGNRGRCAQPCRMPYQMKEDGKSVSLKEDKYVLSPKDMNTIDIIPELVEAGIDSFKIEGRMKRPEYAAGVTYTYRKYVDKYLELGKDGYERFKRDSSKEIEQDMMNLKDLYNRGGFSSGYYTDRNGKIMMSMSRPNHSGVYVGEIKETKGSTATVGLVEELNPQDILEIRHDNESIYEFTVKNKEPKNSKYTFNFKKGLPVRIGQKVYRTKNNQLLDEIHDRYIKEQRKEKIYGRLIAKVNEPLILELTCRDISIQVVGEEVMEAMNQPMTEEKLLKQISKTSESNYQFQQIETTIVGNVFVPVVKLNEIRREGLILLEKAISESHRRVQIWEGASTEGVTHHHRNEDALQREETLEEVASNTDKILITVLVEKEEQLEVVLEQEEVSRIYIESDMVPFETLLSVTKKIKVAGKECYIKLPDIMRTSTYKLFAKNKTILVDNTIDGYLVRTIEEYALLKYEYQIIGKKDIIIDYNMYVMNHEARDFFSSLNVNQTTAPLELNSKELSELTGLYEEMIVYGRIPLMITAQCTLKNMEGKRNVNFNKTSDSPCCKLATKETEIIDRYQKSFVIKRHCRECYNSIYNCDSLSLLEDSREVKNLKVNSVRLWFTTENKHETKSIMEEFIHVYLHGFEPRVELKNVTRGHFKRGIL